MFFIRSDALKRRVGIYAVDIDYQNLGSDDGSDWGFNYGVEAGYEITPELSLSAGYRSFMTAIDIEGVKEDFELEFNSFYAGIAYKFSLDKQCNKGAKWLLFYCFAKLRLDGHESQLTI